jgi:cell division control protein 24
LRDKGDLDEQRRRDIDDGIEAASSVLHRTNAAVDLEERKDAMNELRERVEDWKGHRLESFGDLLLHGTYQVVKGDSSNSKDSEREVRLKTQPTSPLIVANPSCSTRSTSSR